MLAILIHTGDGADSSYVGFVALQCKTFVLRTWFLNHTEPAWRWIFVRAKTHIRGFGDVGMLCCVTFIRVLLHDMQATEK